MGLLVTVFGYIFVLVVTFLNIGRTHWLYHAPLFKNFRYVYLDYMIIKFLVTIDSCVSI